MTWEELARHPLFARVESGEIRALLSRAETFRAAKGETVYDRRRFRRSLGILLEGELQVRREALLVSTLGEGDVFGAAALFNGQEDYPTDLIALTDCTLVLISQEEVRRLIRTCPGFAEDYVIYLSGRIRFLSARLDAVSADSAESKLARYLRSAAGPGGAVTLSATQLCQRIGVGRATLYRAFDVLEGEGTIAREGKTIRILDHQKLRAHCERP